MRRALLWITAAWILGACATAVLPPGSSPESTATPHAESVAATPTAEADLKSRVRIIYLGPLPPQQWVPQKRTPVPGCSPSRKSEILSDPKVHIVRGMLEIRACYQGQAADHAALHAYIDTGQPGRLGFRIGSLVADWLVENDRLYRYAGNGRNWKWQFVAPVEMFESEADEILWWVPLQVIGTSSGRILLEVTDRLWNPAFRTSPLAFGKPEEDLR